jgi:hypothetical protein
MRGASRIVVSASVVAVMAVGVPGCKDPAAKRPDALSKPEEAVVPIPDVPVPPADGPSLGAVSHQVTVYDRPSPKGRPLGYLLAGAKVTRAAEPYTKDGCPGGWYPIRPRGFVCAGQAATIDMNHPTLVAMSIQPQLEAPLPYVYARVTKSTHAFAADPERERGVTRESKLAKSSGMAVVGSWEAKDTEGESHQLAMMTNGRFVPAQDLEKAEMSAFAGVELGNDTTLPIAFVVKRGVRAWAVDGQKTEKRALLDYHRRVDLTGKFRTIDKVRFWEAEDGTWLRHPDVTVIQKRHTLPEFAKGDQRWLDVSIVTGTLVLYEGPKPTFATLVSVGRDRLGDPKTTQSTALGEFRVVAKHVTSVGVDPTTLGEGAHLYDAPWVLELASGQLLHGAYWHDRFGVEHGPGHIQVSPSDALRIWGWTEPHLPAGWHGVRVAEGEATTIVNVRK